MGLFDNIKSFFKNEPKEESIMIPNDWLPYIAPPDEIAMMSHHGGFDSFHSISYNPSSTFKLRDAKFNVVKDFECENTVRLKKTETGLELTVSENDILKFKEWEKSVLESIKQIEKEEKAKHLTIDERADNLLNDLGISKKISMYDVLCANNKSRRSSLKDYEEFRVKDDLSNSVLKKSLNAGLHCKDSDMNDLIQSFMANNQDEIRKNSSDYAWMHFERKNYSDISVNAFNERMHKEAKNFLNALDEGNDKVMLDSLIHMSTSNAIFNYMEERWVDRCAKRALFKEMMSNFDKVSGNLFMKEHAVYMDSMTNKEDVKNYKRNMKKVQDLSDDLFPYIDYFTYGDVGDKISHLVKNHKVAELESFVHCETKEVKDKVDKARVYMENCKAIINKYDKGINNIKDNLRSRYGMAKPDEKEEVLSR